MSDLLRPCDCESGFCNHLPNPFEGHICRQDTIEMAEELTKAIDRIEAVERDVTKWKGDALTYKDCVDSYARQVEALERERDQLKADAKKFLYGEASLGEKEGSQ